MKCLVVIAHPIKDSLCHYLCVQTVAHLQTKGYDVDVIDLYRRNFQPCLTRLERTAYYGSEPVHSEGNDDISLLVEAESLVLIFPTWWFGFPAILNPVYSWFGEHIAQRFVFTGYFLLASNTY